MEYLSIPHYRGPKEKYSKLKHSDGLYFTIDTHEIIAGDSAYGEIISEWSVSDGVLTLCTTGGALKTITFPEASVDAKGLLSAEDKQLLINLPDNLNSKVDKIEGSSLVRNEEIAKLEELPNKVDLDKLIEDAKGSGTGAQSTVDLHLADFNNPHKVTKEQINLGNVTNDAQVKRSEMGVANGVATLDSTGKVLTSQLPGYIDDILEGTYVSETEFTLNPGQHGDVKQSGVIYVDVNTNKSYRWSGSIYVVIASNLALGETSSTAYAGDKGKVNAENINRVLTTRLSHIDDDKAFTATDSTVTLNYHCYADEGYGTEGIAHNVQLPIASEFEAGIITSADKKLLNNLQSNLDTKLDKVDAVGVKSPEGGETFNDPNNKALGPMSHAEGKGTLTTNEAEHAEGKFNKSHKGQTLSSVGNGSDDLNRANVIEIMADGEIYIKDLGNYNGKDITDDTKSLRLVINALDQVDCGEFY